MGVLADIYSGGNTLKRKLNALLADPLGEINAGVTRAREDNNKLLNLFANAYPMAGDKTVLNSPAQIAQFQREAADTGANMGLAGATVGKFVYPQGKAMESAQRNAPMPANEVASGVINNLGWPQPQAPKFYNGNPYYEAPEVRHSKLNKLFAAFGSPGGNLQSRMSPYYARQLHEKGLLKATKKDLELLLDMTDSNGIIRPQVAPP